MARQSIAERIDEIRAWCRAEVLRATGQTWQELLAPALAASHQALEDAIAAARDEHPAAELRIAARETAAELAMDGAVWFEAGAVRIYGCQCGKLNKANNREAAILSIAAGNFPDDMLQTELVDGEGNTTPERAIAVHAEAIRKRRRRWRNSLQHR